MQILNTEDRWFTPDPLGGDITNPQSLNRYAYVLNNPTTLTDPSGLDSQYSFVNDCIVESNSTSVVTSVNGKLEDTVTWSGWQPIVCLPFIPSGPGTYIGGGGAASSIGGGAPAPKATSPVHQMGCSAGNASASSGQYFSGLESAATMLAEFLSGLGPDNLTFGAQSVDSQMMSSSPGVAGAVSKYLSGGGPTGLYTFGLSGLASAGSNPIRQFVGSYTWSVVPTSGGLNVTLSNYTSVHSGAYHLLPSHQRSTFGPLGTTHQIYQVFVPCHR